MFEGLGMDKYKAIIGNSLGSMNAISNNNMAEFDEFMAIAV